MSYKNEDREIPSYRKLPRNARPGRRGASSREKTDLVVGQMSQKIAGAIRIRPRT